MGIINIFSFLVPPEKNSSTPSIVKGTDVPLQDDLFKMLSDIFHRAEKECMTPIRFLMQEDGAQNNEVRNSIISILKKPELQIAQTLAERLRDCTTGKSGLGLLFFIIGEEEETKKIVISRFPADQGILAETKGNTLTIEFVQQVFMKSAKNYKSALYKGSSFDSDFWTGHLVDKQLNLKYSEVAHYWIHNFLDSDFKTTAKAGSRRIALALKDATKKTDDLKVKEEIISCIKLLQNAAEENISINSIVERFHLSDKASNLIISEIPNSQLIYDEFRFDLEEFKNIAAYKSVELDQGQIVTAPADIFDECINIEEINTKDNIYHLSTDGKIVDEKIKSRR